MELREHIGLKTLATQNVKDDCDCHVTREELAESIAAALQMVTSSKASVQTQSTPAVKVSALQTEVADRVLNTESILDKVKKNKGWLAILGLQVAVVAAIIMFM